MASLFFEKEKDVSLSMVSQETEAPDAHSLSLSNKNKRKKRSLCNTSQCTVCRVKLDLNEPGTFEYLPRESKTNKQQHIVCTRCDEYIPILAKTPTACRICAGKRNAVGIAWNQWKQHDTFWCLECLLETCPTQLEKDQLIDIFGR